MKIKLYQVDAFASHVFSGNPAAVCPLGEWLPDEVMQQIAMENNLAETAFYTRINEQVHIRWFTPLVEVDLCGHATLATAHVLFNHEGLEGKKIEFQSRSGLLVVERDHNRLTLDFPTDKLKEVHITEELTDGFNLKPEHIYKGKTDYLFVYKSEEEIKQLQPDFRLVGKIDARGIIVTAPGRESDFVSRFFGPRCGIDEDPVTGSAHTTLTPYWSSRLHKKVLTATQLSKRQGHLLCTNEGLRTKISGEAQTYLVGEIHI